MNVKLYQAACDLFHKVCVLPAAERDRFLARHCQGDAPLLELVRELLANDPVRLEAAGARFPSPDDDAEA